MDKQEHWQGYRSGCNDSIVEIQTMFGVDNPSLDSLLKAMDASWRDNWCDSGLCGCMGCSNGSGGLLMHGFTKEDWQNWVDTPPELVSKEAQKAEMDAFIARVKSQNI